MPTSVLHISFSHSGGAGGVANILSQARTEKGLPTSHWSSIERNLRVAPWSAPRHTVAALVDDAIIRKPEFKAPISLARDGLSFPIEDELNAWDVLHLHNVNGVLSLTDLANRFPAKRMVWTLHDMNPITGTCHYSLGCTGYLSDCSSCPAVRGAFQRGVSLSLKRKTMALRKLTNLTVVAPSQWLADRASESSAFSDVPVHVIPNPIRPIFCAPLDNSAKASKYTFCVVAQDLVDPVKNVAAAVGAFSELRKTYPHISLALVGNNGDDFSAEGVSAFGTLSAAGIAETLSQSRAVIVPSLAENSPLVIAEAAARGSASLVNNVGGMPDLVTSLGAGHVFSHAAELRESMSTVVRSESFGAPAARQDLSSRAISLFSPTSVGQQYDDLYSV